MYAPKQLSIENESIFKLFTRVENAKWCKVRTYRVCDDNIN